MVYWKGKNNKAKGCNRRWGDKTSLCLRFHQKWIFPKQRDNAENVICQALSLYKGLGGPEALLVEVESHRLGFI
jgi:hypothetical protein